MLRMHPAKSFVFFYVHNARARASARSHTCFRSLYGAAVSVSSLKRRRLSPIRSARRSDALARARVSPTRSKAHGTSVKKVFNSALWRTRRASRTAKRLKSWKAGERVPKASALTIIIIPPAKFLQRERPNAQA